MGEKSDKKLNIPYTNRELSWLDFNARVLEEAYEKENPTLERLKFLSITASNLDEFFMVRVAGLREQARAGLKEPDPSGLSPAEQLQKISEKAHAFYETQYSCLSHSIIPALRKNGILVSDDDEISEKQKHFVDDYFERILFPILTPLAIDKSRPFPMLSNKSLNIAVRLKKDGQSHFAVVQVPSILHRFVELPSEKGRAFILLEDIIISHLPILFELHQIRSVSLFRITRNADLSIDEDAEDLLVEIQNSIKKRKRGKPVRLEISKSTDKTTRKFLANMLDVKETDIYECGGPLDLTGWSALSSLPEYDNLRLKPIIPVTAHDFLNCDDIFSFIRERDRFVHLPYESFDCVVNFISKAAQDPDVLAIKQTLYRVSGNSPVINALIKAAENGKQVTVLVELKARFDEENNINWAKKLERAGCHVIYGLAGLKTHCKILLVIRREDGNIRRYLHLSTGNYNDTTAKFYTDMGLFTCRESFGADASSLFNSLTGYSRPPQYNKFITAPHGMRPFFNRMIDMEAENALKGMPSGITIKVNSLQDADIIHRLYDASKAGVKIELLVRGICSLIPGIPNVSENITVHSIIGQLLEHSRIYKFENGGNPKIYLGSADLMPRNLDKRVELIFPIEDEDIKQRLFDIFDLMMNDTVNTRIQNSDGIYEMIDKRGRGMINCQTEFAKAASENLKAQNEANTSY